jgi:hypothetical protein
MDTAAIRAGGENVRTIPSAAANHSPHICLETMFWSATEIADAIVREFGDLRFSSQLA